MVVTSRIARLCTVMKSGLILQCYMGDRGVAGSGGALWGERQYLSSRKLHPVFHLKGGICVQKKDA